MELTLEQKLEVLAQRQHGLAVERFNHEINLVMLNASQGSPAEVAQRKVTGDAIATIAAAEATLDAYATELRSSS